MSVVCVSVWRVGVCVFLNVVVWRLCLCIVRMFMCVVLRVTIVCVLCIQITLAVFKFQDALVFLRNVVGPKGGGAHNI